MPKNLLRFVAILLIPALLTTDVCPFARLTGAPVTAFTDLTGQPANRLTVFASQALAAHETHFSGPATAQEFRREDVIRRTVIGKTHQALFVKMGFLFLTPLRWRRIKVETVPEGSMAFTYSYEKPKSDAGRITAPIVILAVSAATAALRILHPSLFNFDPGTGLAIPGMAFMILPLHLPSISPLAYWLAQLLVVVGMASSQWKRRRGKAISNTDLTSIEPPTPISPHFRLDYNIPGYAEELTRQHFPNLITHLERIRRDLPIFLHQMEQESKTAEDLENIQAVRQLASREIYITAMSSNDLPPLYLQDRQIAESGSSPRYERAIVINILLWEDSFVQSPDHMREILIKIGHTLRTIEPADEFQFLEQASQSIRDPASRLAAEGFLRSARSEGLMITSHGIAAAAFNPQLWYTESGQAQITPFVYLDADMLASARQLEQRTDLSGENRRILAAHLRAIIVKEGEEVQNIYNGNVQGYIEQPHVTSQMRQELERLKGLNDEAGERAALRLVERTFYLRTRHDSRGYEGAISFLRSEDISPALASGLIKREKSSSPFAILRRLTDLYALTEGLHGPDLTRALRQSVLLTETFALEQMAMRFFFLMKYRTREVVENPLEQPPGYTNQRVPWMDFLMDQPESDTEAARLNWLEIGAGFLFAASMHGWGHYVSGFLAAVILHELGHGLAAWIKGYPALPRLNAHGIEWWYRTAPGQWNRLEDKTVQRAGPWTSRLGLVVAIGALILGASPMLWLPFALATLIFSLADGTLSFVTQTVSRTRGLLAFRSLMVAASIAVGAATATAQVAPPTPPALTATQIPDGNLSLQNVLVPELPLFETPSDKGALDRIDEVLKEVKRLGLSRVQAAATMGLSPAAQSVYTRYGVLTMGSVAREAAILALAPLLDLPAPGQMADFQFMIAPHDDQIKGRSEGAFYNFYYKGIVFVNTLSPDAWAHEFGHHLFYNLPKPVQDELVRQHALDRDAFGLISNYARDGDPESNDPTSKQYTPSDRANQAFAEITKLYMLHSDQLFQNPAIMGNSHLRYFIEQCARTFVFSRNGQNLLRFYTPVQPGGKPTPDYVDIPITLPKEESSPSVVTQLETMFTQLGDFERPDIPLEFAQERMRVALQSVDKLKLSRAEAADQLRLPPSSREIYLRHGIVVLTPSDAETARIGAFLDVLWPGLAQNLNYILVRPLTSFTQSSGGTQEAFDDIKGKGIIIRSTFEEDSFLNALGIRIFNNLPSGAQERAANEYKQAHKVFSVIAPEADSADPAQGFGAVLRLLYRRPEDIFWKAGVFGDFYFEDFVHDLTWWLDFRSGDLRTQRIYRPTIFAAEAGPGFIDYAFRGDPPDFEEQMWQHAAFVPSLHRFTDEGIARAMRNLDDNKTEERRKSLAYLADALKTAGELETRYGPQNAFYFENLRQSYLTDLGRNSYYSLYGLMRCLDERDHAALVNAQLILKNLPPTEDAAYQETMLKAILSKSASIAGRKDQQSRQNRDLLITEAREFMGGVYQDATIKMLYHEFDPGQPPTSEPTDSTLVMDQREQDLKFRKEMLSALDDATVLSKMDGARISYRLTDYLINVGMMSSDRGVQETVSLCLNVISKAVRGSPFSGMEGTIQRSPAPAAMKKQWLEIIHSASHAGLFHVKPFQELLWRPFMGVHFLEPIRNQKQKLNQAA